jgi:hypothetical protein
MRFGWKKWRKWKENRAGEIGTKGQGLKNLLNRRTIHVLGTKRERRHLDDGTFQAGITAQRTRL